jgi:hypothetical protein
VQRLGAQLATDLGQRDREFLRVFSPDIEPLQGDAQHKVRRLARLFF